MFNEAFENYYQSIYGGRWERLRAALLEKSNPVMYRHNLKEAYYLDSASVLAANSLRLPDEGLVLDACAAPGGKTLVIASLMDENTKLLSNEISGERRRRLVNTVNQCAAPALRERISVSAFDAAKLAGRRSERGRFSGILLDAPCSSERHIMQNEKLLAQWTQARPRFLAKRQWALLSAAFLLLKKNSSLVYSTCAISPAENDEVAERLLSKYGEALSVDAPDFSEGEATKHGRLILPDEANGAGPMYVARFWKR
jgi:16S rRNA (cytosine1407-C5)-methyltransferase